MKRGLFMTDKIIRTDGYEDQNELMAYLEQKAKKKDESKKRLQITLTLEPKQYNFLDQYCTTMHIKKSRFFRELIDNFVADLQKEMHEQDSNDQE